MQGDQWQCPHLALLCKVSPAATHTFITCDLHLVAILTLTNCSHIVSVERLGQLQAYAEQMTDIYLNTVRFVPLARSKSVTMNAIHRSV